MHPGVNSYFSGVYNAQIEQANDKKHICFLLIELVPKKLSIKKNNNTSNLIKI